MSVLGYPSLPIKDASSLEAVIEGNLKEFDALAAVAERECTRGVGEGAGPFDIGKRQMEAVTLRACAEILRELADWQDPNTVP